MGRGNLRCVPHATCSSTADCVPNTPQFAAVSCLHRPVTAFPSIPVLRVTVDPLPSQRSLCTANDSAKKAVCNTDSPRTRAYTSVLVACSNSIQGLLALSTPITTCPLAYAPMSMRPCPCPVSMPCPMSMPHVHAPMPPCPCAHAEVWVSRQVQSYAAPAPGLPREQHSGQHHDPDSPDRQQASPSPSPSARPPCQHTHLQRSESGAVAQPAQPRALPAAAAAPAAASQVRKHTRTHNPCLFWLSRFVYVV